MNGKAMIMGILIGVIALFTALEYGYAGPQTAGSAAKIGIVSVRGVFNGSKRHVQYRAQALARQSRAKAQMDDLTKEVEAEEAELKTLKQGTADYLQQLQVVLEKRAKLESQQEYLKRQQAFEDKKWMEDLYQEVLRLVKEIASQKGLDLVLERTAPEFPVSSDELMLTFSTHKVLYEGGCVDLTAEVIARLDAAQSAKPSDNP